MNQNIVWISILLGLILIVAGNGIFNLATENESQEKEDFIGYYSDDVELSNDYTYDSSYINPYFRRILPWFRRFFYFPGLTPAYFRNYGDMLDPYYPRYYQTYYDEMPYYYQSDLPYYYYNRNNFDRYRKVWGKSRRPEKRCRRHLKLVPGARTRSKSKCKKYC